MRKEVILGLEAFIENVLGFDNIERFQ